MRLDITFSHLVYKDRTKNKKRFISYKMEDSGSLIREVPYCRVEIDQICLLDNDQLIDITEKYTKNGKDQYIHSLLKEIFYDYGFKF